MSIAKNIIAKLQAGLEDEKLEHTVGTPEHPLYVPRTKRHILTGSAARRQDGDLAQRAFKTGAEKDEDAFFPLARRAHRRHAQQVVKAQRRRGQRAYVKRELAKERAAGDLANLFRIIDNGPGHPFYKRACDAIEARVTYLVNEDLKANPDSELTGAAIEEQLRALAGTADTWPHGSARTKANRAAKAARRKKALVNFAESQRVGHAAAGAR